jgi:hypothetical protein
VIDAIRGKRRSWIPTNGVAATAVDGTLFAEAAFGILLLIVPIIYFPELLYLPCWFLFAGKFLFGPALSLVYRDDPNATVAHADLLDRNRPVVPFRTRDRAALERVGAS